MKKTGAYNFEDLVTQPKVVFFKNKSEKNIKNIGKDRSRTENILIV